MANINDKKINFQSFEPRIITDVERDLDAKIVQRNLKSLESDLGRSNNINSPSSLSSNSKYSSGWTASIDSGEILSFNEPESTTEEWNTNPLFNQNIDSLLPSRDLKFNIDQESPEYAHSLILKSFPMWSGRISGVHKELLQRPRVLTLPLESNLSETIDNTLRGSSSLTEQLWHATESIATKAHDIESNLVKSFTDMEDAVLNRLRDAMNVGKSTFGLNQTFGSETSYLEEQERKRRIENNLVDPMLDARKHRFERELLESLQHKTAS